MVDVVLPFIVFTLVAVIVIQGVITYFNNEQARKTQKELLTAILAKNATDFSIATKIDKEVVTPKSNPDEIPLSEATDEEFDKHIQQELEEEEE